MEVGTPPKSYGRIDSYPSGRWEDTTVCKCPQRHGVLVGETVIRIGSRQDVNTHGAPARALAILVKLLLGSAGGEAGPQARLPPAPREKRLLHQAQSNMGQVDETVYVHSARPTIIPNACVHRALRASVFGIKKCPAWVGKKMIG